MAAKKNEKKVTKTDKPGKHKKAPGIFKKAVKLKKWEKKYLKKIYLPDDRKFLESLAVEKEGLVSIDGTVLSEKDYKRLKMLGRAIKTNRKSLNLILVLILIIIIGGGIFFQLYLKNKLVQRFVETQLEKVFLAEVDTLGVNFSIFKGEFSLEYLAIADAASPMRNLIEFTGIKADLKTSEILQGRVFIEELGFYGLKRGSERTVSGELQSDLAGEVLLQNEPADPGKNVIGDVVGKISAIAGDVDVKELLEQQKENLKSFNVIDDSKSRVDQYAENWKSRSSEWSGKVDDWETSVKYIRTVDADSFESIAAAQTTIDRLQNIYSDAERDYAEIERDYSDAEQQYADVSNMMKEIKTAVEADYEYIESLVTLPAGDKVDWAASIFEEQFSLPLKKYLSYLDRGLEWYERFQKLSKIREKSSPEKRRTGRSLPAPIDAPPAFVLVHAFASGEEPGIKYGFNLNNLVSEPDRWEGLASLEIGIDTAETGAAEVLITEENLNLTVPAAPFDLGDSLKGLDVDSFSGILTVSSMVGWDEIGFNGNIDIGAEDLVLNTAKDNSIQYRLINTAIESVKPLSAEGVFAWNDTDGLELELETDLDDGLGNAVTALISEGADEGLKILKDYLGEQIDGPMEEFESAKSELETRVDELKSYQSEINSYKQTADSKIEEIRKSVEDNVRKEAEALIKNAIPDGTSDAVKKGLGGVLNF